MVCKYAEFHTLRFCNPNWLSHVMSSRDYIIPFGSRCSWKLWVIKMNHIVLTSKQTVDFWYTISACHFLSSSTIWASKLVFYLYPGVLRLYPTIFHLRYDHRSGKGVERNNESSRESLTTVPTCLNLIKYNVIGCIEGVMNQSKSSSTMFNKTAMKSTQINPKSSQWNFIDK